MRRAGAPGRLAPFDWAMDRVVQLVRGTRERTFVRESGGMPVSRTTAIASIGGAVFDNEENYLLVKTKAFVCDVRKA